MRSFRSARAVEIAVEEARKRWPEDIKAIEVKAKKQAKQEFSKASESKANGTEPYSATVEYGSPVSNGGGAFTHH